MDSEGYSRVILLVGCDLLVVHGPAQVIMRDACRNEYGVRLLYVVVRCELTVCEGVASLPNQKKCPRITHYLEYVC